MRKYKENEDSREKFFEERTKNPKQIFGAGGGAGGASNPSDTFGNMFSGTGDMALQRKMEKASLTVEKVADENTVRSLTSLDFKNGVIQPETTTHSFGKMSDVNYE